METQPKQIQDKSLLIIIVLLLLRFPLLILGGFNIVPETMAFVIYLCATYLFTGIFIYLKRNTLAQYNITPIALIIFFIAPIAAIIAGRDNDPTLWVRVIMSALFLIFLFTKGKYRFNFTKVAVKKTILDILFTVLLCVVVPVLIHAIRGFPTVDVSDSERPLLIGFFFPYIWFFQLSSAAISEEPLFRGFIWGYLKNKGIKDPWICVIQALLFWAGHIYYIGTGINFWIVHPLFAIFIGLLVWKTRSITHTMIFHSCVNTFVDYLRFIPFR